MRAHPIRFPRRLTVATPAYDGRTVLAFARSMQRLQRVCTRRGIRLQWLTTSGTVVDVAREVLAAGFLRSRDDVLVFVDADVAFEVRTVLELRQLAERLDVVGVAVPTKRIAWRTVWRAARSIPEQHAAEVLPAVCSTGRDLQPVDASAPLDIRQPIEVAWCGTSILAVHRRVFDRIAEAFPDLRYTQADATGTPTTAYFSPFVDNGERLYEDGAFCARWRKLGGKCWAVLWPNVSHVGAFTFTDDAGLRAALRLPLSDPL
jgi:hypothetical protein